ncbi:winged helix-turn-helix transcriptional regulator [Planomonospora parontospora]|uniref:winged helix-turn-helix transcriptional regulator n=1 Tax=Planomonospora parontospora TaxID=58119 RepID=UPI0016702896|nr:helix-turn-helix domain-containing protein [Planomonospora parontospora]GGL15994.1 MarR family transcriptional regulator [Planomonospora parontospora subsp. antibiotica]GII15424.1 MarR family transcriptional regulator [Planomonospora parontospora subsp. antibiotica]
MGSSQVDSPVTPETCSVTRTLSFVGSKWTPLVIFHLLPGAKRYGELQHLLPGISPKTLADRLQTLEGEGLLTRTVHPDKPPRVEYALTRRGHELGEILNSIAEWAES